MRTIAPFAIALLLPAACSDGAAGGDDHAPGAEPGTQDAGGAAEVGTPGRVAIPPTVRRNLGIGFAEVQARRVAQTIRIPGAFEFTPRARREYRMVLPGRVELLVDQLDEVAAGNPLYRFQSPRWPELQHEIILATQAINTAQADIALAHARITEAERTLAALRARLESLHRAEFRDAALETEAERLAARLPRLEAELARAETRLDNARGTRAHALHRAAVAAGIPLERVEREMRPDGGPVPPPLDADWITVRAAVAGVVEELAVTDGAFVEDPGLVLTVVQPRALRFRARALQADLPRLREDAAARIVPPRTAGLDVAGGIPASLRFGVEAHPAERTLTLWATPREVPPWARAGVSAFLEIETQASGGPVLAIPRSAVVQDGLHRVFFRRSPADPNVALRVEADLGVSDGRWVEVRSGLMRSDEVVLEGAYELNLASQADGGAPQGGHVHPDGTVHEEGH